MSKENTELDALLDYQADLDWALSEKDWKKASEVIFTVFEEGYEQEARIMNQSLQRAYKESESKEWVWEPIEPDTDQPYLTPEEDDAPKFTSESEHETVRGDDGELYPVKK